MSSSSFPRVVGLLVGDVEREPDARVKYGQLFETLGQCLPLVAVHDVNLHGVERWITALRVFRPGRRRWRQRFYKDVTAFRRRSRRAGIALRALAERTDVVLQVGVLFDARWGKTPPPSIIYTDYTARLSARSSFAGRSPLSGRRLERWFEVETQAYHRATHVLTRSEHVRASLLDDYELPGDRVTAIGGGVNFPELPVLDTRHVDRPPTALFIGQELVRKGGDILLRAFASARRKVPDARLVLVTGDAVPDELPLDGVTIVRPTWDRARVAELFQKADLFVLPSRLETWGDVLLEAMAYGLPCVGVRGEAMEEIIVPGETGLLVPPEDVEGLATALTELLSDSRHRRLWGLAARRRVETRFTWERVAERMVPFLEAAASGAG